VSAGEGEADRAAWCQYTPDLSQDAWHIGKEKDGEAAQHTVELISREGQRIRVHHLNRRVLEFTVSNDGLGLGDHAFG
jgi:hypothetical protein